MRVLLDTHVLIWANDLTHPLPKNALDVILDGETECLLSAAVPWEIAIKIGTGKLRVPTSLAQFVETMVTELELTHLPIEARHSIAVAELPESSRHHDPFDRLLIAQALVEGVPIVTSDRWFAQYGVQVIW